MDRTITVRGTGKLKVKPDVIEISLTLRSRDKDYANAMEASAKQQESLRAALEATGFSRDALKTSSFNVHTEYEGVRDKNGNYRNEFAGYVCEHMLVLRFGFDTEKLSAVLAALSSCLAEPELYISFTVKDKEAISDALLSAAAENAKKRAKLLASGAGAELGSIVSVDYSWNNPDFISPTRMNFNAKNMRAIGKAESAMDMGIAAEDIELNENATFTWELVPKE